MRNAVGFSRVTFWLLATVAVSGLAPRAHALSGAAMEPAAENGTTAETFPQQAFEGTTLPKPDIEGESAQGEAKDKPSATPAAPQTGSEDATPPVSGAADADAGEPANAEIIRDLSTLPEPVRQMRERIVEAAASGDIERLRPLIQGTLKPPQIMNNEADDPIDTLKNFSGDPDGQEILAIMLDILATGVARIDAGSPDEVYVWPYFMGKSLASLTPPERVELLRIVTAGDLMGMEENGNYNFYRLGIAPDGQWKFMAGGD